VAPWAALSTNLTALTEQVLSVTPNGTIFLKQVAFDLALMNSIPENVKVACSYQDQYEEFINPLDTTGSPYQIEVGQGVTVDNYIARDSQNRICFTSTNASYVFNSVTYSLHSQGKGGLISIKTGCYNLTNSILSYGGIKLQGEGLNKFASQQGTKLQLEGGSFPLILINGTGGVFEYFTMVSDMELFGNANTEKTFDYTLYTNCSAGVMLTGSASDFLLENLFIHNFAANIYVDNGIWYGRIVKCWLENSVFGVYAEQKQLIISESNLSGLTYGLYAVNGATDILVSACHFYLNSNTGVYIEQHAAGTYTYNFGTSDFTDCTEQSFKIYAYTGVKINATIVNGNFGFQDQTTQKYAISTWTYGTAQISMQVGLSRFNDVTIEPLHDLGSSSTNNVNWCLGYNVGNITNTAP
jgi:hypothetical protein